jgi:hypothetical protein
MKEENNTIIAYKGFDKNLCCKGFQYEVGKEYELPKGEKPEVCSKGFHACTSPLEVLDYYFMDNNANLSRFCEVEQSGKFSKEENSTKVASSKIKIKAEITFADLIKLGIEWLKEKASTENLKTNLNDNGVSNANIGSSGYSARIVSSGNYAKIGSSGDFANIASSGYAARIGSSGNYANIASSGNYANIVSSGYSAQISSSSNYAKIGSSGDFANIASSGSYAKIVSSGKDAAIMCAGHNSIVKAKKGSWITLAEWYERNSCGKMKPKCVKTEYVDGKRIKADTWYKLVDGEFVEVDK